MRRPLAGLLMVVPVLVLLLAEAACTSRLDEQQVRARLLEQSNLRGDLLTIRSISSADLPVAVIDYGGVETQVRFRRQDGVWVIDAVGEAGRMEPADRAARALGERLAEKAHARWLADVMPRYARTLKLLVGWSDLLAQACGTGLPVSNLALFDLHATWHRTLFPNRGTEFHITDLFERDAWRRSLRTSMSFSRIEVVSAGPDATLGTPDDMRMVYERTVRGGGMTVCGAHYVLPEFVVDALGRADAPPDWNCSDMLQAFKQARILDVVKAGAPR